MRRPSSSIVLVMVFGAGLGFTFAHAMDKRAAAKGLEGSASPSSLAASNDTAPPPLTIEAWLAGFEAINWERPDGARLAELQKALATDPSLHGTVLNAYRTKTDPRMRNVLRRMLTADASPELAARAVEMATSDDLLDRTTGFELMSELPPSGESTVLAKRALGQEHDAAVLAAVLLALRPRIPPSPHDIQQMLPRFQKLLDHESALVRAHSVQLIAEWDRAGATAERTTARALTDEATLVRQAAVGAVMIGQLRSAPVKAGLLAAVQNSEEEIQTRFAAHQALERFDLSAEEYENFMRARRDIEKKAESLQH